MDSVLSHEPLIRIGCFAGLLILLALLESGFPRRRQRVGRRQRWPGNLGIVAIDSIVARLLVPITTVSLGAIVETKGWGLLGVLGIAGWPAVVLAFLALDLGIYVQHIVFHTVPLLWRLHRMHHADLELDVTTGLRFHPIEIVLSLLIKCVVIIAVGAPAFAVLVFEIALNATSMFNHANLALPPNLDRLLRHIVVTPDMHRVHHSIRREETNSNFGFNLPWWDRLFCTGRPQPVDGHLDMEIGIPQFRDPGELRLDRMLIQPFHSDPPSA